jgi:hypothetical protein
VRDWLIAIACGVLFLAIALAIATWMESCRLDVRPTFNKPRSGDVIVWQSCEPPCCDLDFDVGVASEFAPECREP